MPELIELAVPDFIRVPSKRFPRLSRTLLGIGISLAGIAVTAWMVEKEPPPVAGVRDFMTFYMGAKLAGTPDLYNEAAGWAVQDRILGRHSTMIPYVRLPFWAFFLKPVLLLPYYKAQALWLGLIVLSLAIFVWTFPMDRLLTMSLVCWSLPAALCVLMAQDTTFLLIWIALSLACWRKGRPFLAGLIFSMCLAKFHFLTFIPLLLLLQRRWRFGLGFATGFILLLGVSFAVQGIHWPADYLHMLLHGNAQPARDVMYNIRGALPDSLQAFYIYLAGCAVVAVLVAAVCLRREFDLALCLCLLGALMVSPHVYAQDYVLAVPLCALLLARRTHLHPGSLPAAAMLSCPFVLHSIPGTILIGLFVLAVSAVTTPRQADRHA